jgi:mRNA interferase RelE/StbE
MLDGHCAVTVSGNWRLHRALACHYKIKLRKQGYRLVYGVQDDILMVMAGDQREDCAVYQSAMACLSQLASELPKVTTKRH